MAMGCPLVSPAGAEPRRAADPPAERPAAQGNGLHVLVLNGGGNANENFRSHLLHIREMTTLLLGAGVSQDQLTVIASDGQHPAADVALRAAEPDDAWLLEGTGLERWLDEPLSHENTTVAGPDGGDLPVEPATRSSISRFFQAARARLSPGDTLLLYVTDHGKDDPRDPRGNRITLWGPRESLTVTQLSRELERLPLGVRVVALMSQCYSGGFAHLLDWRERDGLPSGAACGYFATTADRPAYGCYPEATSVDRVGHSFAMIDALSTTASLPEAHAQVLRSDRTPDVPVRTVDAYLAERVRSRARATRQHEVAFADRLLAATQPPGPARPELVLADAVARTFGLPRPSTVTAIDVLTEEIARERRRLERHGELWEGALTDMTRAHYDRFLAAYPDWLNRVSPRSLRALPEAQRRTLARQLLRELSAYTDASPGDRRRLQEVVDKMDEAREARYRHEVRAAGLLRVRALLMSAAGRTLLATSGSEEERQALAAVEGCEALTLPGPAAGKARKPRPTNPGFPSLSEERTLTERLHPSWLGIAFRGVNAGTRRQLGVGDGAALVTGVQPGSPAQVGGLRAGDIVLGPPGAPFDRANQIRSFTMLSPRTRPLAMEIIRQGVRRKLELNLTAAPVR